MYQGEYHPRDEKPRKPGSRVPFKHASVIYMQAMALRQKLQNDLFTLSVELARLPAYVSRGRGGRHRSKNRLIEGRWTQDRSKYKPHQGNTECARRVFQAMSPAIRAEARKLGQEVFDAEFLVTPDMNVGGA